MENQQALNERLFLAVQQNEVEAAQAALASGADANYRTTRRHPSGGELHSAVTDSVPMLFLACELRSAPLVGLLLSFGADPNAHLESTWSDDDPDHGEMSYYAREPCLFAALPDETTLLLLLTKGADPNAPARRKESSWEQLTHVLSHPAASKELRALLDSHGASIEKLPLSEYELFQRKLAREQEEAKQREVEKLLRGSNASGKKKH